MIVHNGMAIVNGRFDHHRHPYPDYPFQHLHLALSSAMLHPVRVGRHYQAECPRCERRTLDLIRLPDGRPALRPRCRCSIDAIWDGVIDGAEYNGIDAERGLADWDFELLRRGEEPKMKRPRRVRPRLQLIMGTAR